MQSVAPVAAVSRRKADVTDFIQASDEKTDPVLASEALADVLDHCVLELFGANRDQPKHEKPGQE